MKQYMFSKKWLTNDLNWCIVYSVRGTRNMIDKFLKGELVVVVKDKDEAEKSKRVCL